MQPRDIEVHNQIKIKDQTPITCLEPRDWKLRHQSTSGEPIILTSTGRPHFSLLTGRLTWHWSPLWERSSAIGQSTPLAEVSAACSGWFRSVIYRGPPPDTLNGSVVVSVISSVFLDSCFRPSMLPHGVCFVWRIVSFIVYSCRTYPWTL